MTHIERLKIKVSDEGQPVSVVPTEAQENTYLGDADYKTHHILKAGVPIITYADGILYLDVYDNGIVVGSLKYRYLVDQNFIGNLNVTEIYQ